MGIEEKKVARISQNEVVRALGEQVEAIRAHLDLEGICYIKLTRTGANECFASDRTSEVLKSEGLDYRDQERELWRRPAMEKWAR
jgi:hypothetical protein